MKLHRSFFAAAALTLSLAACATQPAATSNVRQIVSTTSFGMCAGYCSTRLELTEGHALLIRNGHGRGVPDLPEQRFESEVTPAEWQELSALAANANLSALPETIGCPDCADGGAESIAVANGAGEPRTVTFDYNASVQQAQPLLEKVRQWRLRLTPQGDSVTR